MAMQESNETKFFDWLKTKVILVQCQEMQKNKGAISMLLMQKRVIKQPLFSMDNADEVANLTNKVASCFASKKTNNMAVRMVRMYATYLKERASAPCNVVKTQQESMLVAKNGSEYIYSLRVGDKVYAGESPTIVFAHFCAEMAATYPLKIRSLVGIRICGKVDVPLKKDDDGNCIKIANIKAYVDNRMLTQQAEGYTRWVCDMCGVKLPTISVSLEHAETIVQETPMVGQNAVPDQGTKQVKAEPDPVVVSVAIKQEPAVAVARQQPKKKDNPILGKMEQIVLQADMDGMSYDDLKDALQITMVLTKQLVAQSTKVVDIKGTLIHEEAFIDWEDGADALETIIEKLMQKNYGYISSTQLFEYARNEMNMFLNDNGIREERAVYDMAQHLFEKVHYHEKVFAFRGKMHISCVDVGISSNLDIYKKYAADQGGVFSFNGLIEYLESIGVSTGNLRNQMRMWAEPIFFFYDYDVIATAEALRIDEDWKKAIKKSLDVLFDDAGDHMILRNIPSIWFERLPAISGNCPWTPLLLQSVLRFYNKELGARTIQALDGQSLETLHTMLVADDSSIQNFGDVVISYLLEQNIERREFEAEELRLLLADGGILHGNELIWNMPKALKQDGRFAWDASGNNVTVKI